MPAETPEDRYSILLVEDDPGVADTLTTFLQEYNYVVHVCKDGKDVLPKLLEQKFALLILDVLLPHVSGFAVADQLRAQPHLRDTPLIMISGIYRSRNHRSHVMQAFKALDYLDKPVNLDRLLELCRKALGEPNRQVTTKVAVQQPDLHFNPTARMQVPDSLNLTDEEAKLEQQQVEDDARRKFRPSAFVSQGSIKSQPVPALLARLWHSRASGALLLRRGEVKKIVSMRQGTPYTVQSNLVSECLGQVLVHERLISRDECEQSIAWMRRSGRKQGEILVDELKCITLQNLQFGLEVQLETKLFSTFNWDTGAFRFSPSASLPDVTNFLQRRSPGLIVEGIRRCLSETFMRSQLLPALDTPVTWRSQDIDLGQLGLTPQERTALKSVNLPNTCRDLLETTPLEPAETLRLLYAFIALELWVPVELR